MIITDFLLNSGNNDLTTYFSWGALAAGDTTTYSSQTAIMYALTDENDCTTDATSMFAIMEILPTPFGVTPPSDSSSRKLTENNSQQLIRTSSTTTTNRNLASSSTSVVISGTVDGWKDVLLGYNYYTNTMGDIFSSGTYYGRDDITSSMTSEYYYIYNEDTNTIVTSESRIGYSSDDGTIFIQSK